MFILNNSSIKVVISVESVLVITHFTGRHQKWLWFGRKEVCCFYFKHNELWYEITPILIALFPIQHHLLLRIRPIYWIALTQIFFSEMKNPNLVMIVSNAQMQKQIQVDCSLFTVLFFSNFLNTDHSFPFHLSSVALLSFSKIKAYHFTLT